MNKKLLTAVQAKCKDMGLTPKAIEDLVQTGSEGLTDESSDEDIENEANRLQPFAKMMQSEGTRWAQKVQPDDKKNDKGGKKSDNENEPSWFADFKKANEKRLEDLETENTTLKNEKAVTERGAVIKAKATELNIPDYLMKRFKIADNEDINKELTDFKQDLVTNKLIPEDSGGIKSTSEDAQKEAATSILDEVEVK